VSSAALDFVLEELWSPVVAVTAAHNGRANGLISSSVVTASILPEAPRISLLLAQEHLTHDLVLASGSFAVHLLPADPVDRSLEVFRMLGFRTGRTADKLGAFPWRPGTTGAPLLDEALAYVEARVVRTLDADDFTVVVADVVAAGRLREGRHLTIADVRAQLTEDDWAAWEARLTEEREEARRRRAPERDSASE
jgi:flavin reductase (DIM6/NTAB) family NADH-FMN oxidoreductase RutF